MVDIENTFLLTLMLFIIGFGTFGSIGTSSSANDTNTTNVTNTTTNMLAQAPAADSSSTYISLQVTPKSLSLGSRLADNTETSYPAQTTIQTKAEDTNPFSQLNLYVMATGNMVSTSNSANVIPINNLKYDGFGNSSLQKTSFSTNYKLVRYWNSKSILGLYYYVGTIGFLQIDPISVTGNYYLTVPYGTRPGTYQVTIEYVAVADTDTQPV